MVIAADLLEQIVEHAVRDAPDECCGLVAVRGGQAIAVHPAQNAAASPLRFEIDGRELLALVDGIEEGGLELGGIYHSHTRSAPYPSQTDVNFAALWPGIEWLIVGVSGEAPEVRSYLIDQGAITEVEVRPPDGG
jgi:proteasome lid subunit RPN8/RPN11